MGNGFDISNFGNLISNLGKASAAMQNDKEKIDTKSELNTYVSGWDAIKAKAETEKASGADVDISSLENDMKSELASLMGADFSKKVNLDAKTNDKNEPVFSAEDISLENMMSLLEPEDGLDIDKIREYNKQPMLSRADEQEAVDTLTDAGFSQEFVDVLVDFEPGALKYITNSIKDGRADTIRKQTENFDELANNHIDANIIGYLQNDEDIFA